MPVYIPQAKAWGFDGGVIICVSPQVFRSNTQLTRFVARGPRALQCRLYPKTSNQVNLV